MAMVPIGAPVVGEIRVTGDEPGLITLVLPATVKPVTRAIAPGGTLALSRTLPVACVFIGTVAAFGSSVSNGCVLEAAGAVISRGGEGAGEFLRVLRHPVRRHH